MSADRDHPWLLCMQHGVTRSITCPSCGAVAVRPESIPHDAAAPVPPTEEPRPDA